MTTMTDCKVRWNAPAELQEREPLAPAKKADWVGKVLCQGTTASALRRYRSLAPEVQERCDLFIGVGVVDGSGGLIYGDELRNLAVRSDLPE